MTFQLSDFDEFFSVINGGHKPFTWQLEVLEQLSTTGSWPERIAVPTGAGKSSVVDIHIFAVALNAIGKGTRVPRRLHTVVNRRGLVDNQHQHAMKIGRMLDGAKDEKSILGEVSRALQELHIGVDAPSALVTSVLRGGLSHRHVPVDDLTSCAVISSTPDMWGSRALFRGYGSTRQSRPRETALLTMDSAIVVDEAHLNRQLLKTARRISQIQHTEFDLGVPRLQVVETTATPHGGSANNTISIDVHRLDDDRDRELQLRLHSTKALDCVVSEKWNGRDGNRDVVAEIVKKVAALMASPERSGTVGCVVNHVKTAVEVTKRLEKDGLKVATLVGRMRPSDLKQLNQKHPSLLTVDGDAYFDAVVATQTLEVGVDVDFWSMVTELAPASSLAQRFGRVNRLGKYDNSRIIVFVPSESFQFKAEHPPYSGTDLAEARQWLERLQEQGSVNPVQLTLLPPPESSPTRLLYQRLELRDLELLARTSLKDYAEPELELWLHDSLEADRPLAGIAVRSAPTLTDNALLELLGILPPSDEETFPVTMKDFRDVLSSIAKHQSLTEGEYARAFIHRSGETHQYMVGERTQPGDVLILEPTFPLTTANVITEIIQATDIPEPVEPEGVTILLNGETESSLVARLFEQARGLSSEEVAALWNEFFNDTPVNSVEVSEASYESDSVTMEEPAWIVGKHKNIVEDTPAALQEWSPRQAPVLLPEHQTDVAERTEEIATSLGLNSALQQQLVIAARYHDEGKSDPRFQQMLGNKDPEVLWAKSKLHSYSATLLAKAASNLPPGWRHEQLSAALVVDKLNRGDLEADELAIHIIGTSHGHGRGMFTHTGEDLASGFLAAKRLFTDGEWDSLTRQVQHRYGFYATAYLEAIERAADAQVSKEGR